MNITGKYFALDQTSPISSGHVEREVSSSARQRLFRFGRSISLLIEYGARDGDRRDGARRFA
jgi:hypothetical protein